jgi:hypothetical protein
VLIESRQSPRSALPVLRRGADDRGPIATTTLPPSITALHPPRPYVAARLGDDVEIEGQNLGGAAVTARIRHPSLPQQIIVVPNADGSSDRVVVHIPDDAVAIDTWIAGVTTISLSVERPPLPVWTTNELPLPVAPRITVAAITDLNTGDTEVKVTCTPVVRRQQTVLLLFGDAQIAPDPPPEPQPGPPPPPPPPGTPTTLTFQVRAAAGTYVVRLRVDGVDSIPVTREPVTGLLKFDPDQMVTLP